MITDKIEPVNHCEGSRIYYYDYKNNYTLVKADTDDFVSKQ